MSPVTRDVREGDHVRVVSARIWHPSGERELVYVPDTAVVVEVIEQLDQLKLRWSSGDITYVFLSARGEVWELLADLN